MLKSILFTHNDLDGAGCRIVYEITRDCDEEKGVDYEVVICSNANVDENVQRFLNDTDNYDSHTEVWFADIVCSRELMRVLTRKFHTVKVFDHHVTNFPIQQELPTAIIIPENSLGKKESGASLLYQHFIEIACADPKLCWAEIFTTDPISKFLAKFVDTVRTYDTFEFKETHNVLAKKLQMFYLFIGMEQFCNRYIGFIVNPSSDPKSDIILADGDLSYVINEKITNEQRIIDRITPDDVLTIPMMDGKYKAAFSMPVYGANVSELAYQFLRKYPEYDIFVQFSLSNGMEFSYRTAKDELNLGELAVIYGGGGHPKASGSPLPSYLRGRIIDILRNYLDSEWRYWND